MSLHDFLIQLSDTGRVNVGRDWEQEPDAQVDAVLRELDDDVRLEMPADAPALDLAAARWAALVLYRACCFLAFRDVSAEVVREHLEKPCPGRVSPATCYSVDLALRHLPELFNLARGLAPDDPLVVCIRRLGMEWPLSSVGIPELGPVDPSPFLCDPSLRTLYADRILDRKDSSRLDDVGAQAAVRCALGAHTELAPEVAAVLAKEGHDG